MRLVERLRAGGFTLLDSQYANTHMEQFGLVEIPAEAYERKLAVALGSPASWAPAAHPAGPAPQGSTIV